MRVSAFKPVVARTSNATLEIRHQRPPILAAQGATPTTKPLEQVDLTQEPRRRALRGEGQNAAAPFERTRWNPQRMAEVADDKTTQLLEAFAAPGYVGPTPESSEAVRAFMAETIPHTYRVRQVAERLGFSVNGHDLVETVPLDALQRLTQRLTAEGQHDPSWLIRLCEQYRARGADTIDVGKLNPAVVAGLARTGAPDRVALELHRLSAHHANAGDTEMIIDVIDALVQPRQYKAGMSHEAARKIFFDMVEKGQLKVDDTPALRAAVARVVAAHQALGVSTWNR